MEFVAANCPKCAGILQIPDDRDIVKCMYCGVDIIVSQVINPIKVNRTNANSLRNYTNIMELADSAFNAKNYIEA